MRGGEAAGADACGAQHGGRVCADGSFAIGAGDVDCFPGGGAAQDQAVDASQAWRDHVISVAGLESYMESVDIGSDKLHVTLSGNIYVQNRYTFVALTIMLRPYAPQVHGNIYRLLCA